MLMLIIVMGQTQFFQETLLHLYKKEWSQSRNFLFQISTYLSCILLLILFCFGLIGYI